MSTASPLCVRLRDAQTGATEWRWLAEVDQSSRFEVRPTEDRGLAVFAQRPFEVGELIMADEPLLRWWQDVDAPREENLRVLLAAVDALDDASRANFLCLMQAPHHGESKHPLGLSLIHI